MSIRPSTTTNPRPVNEVALAGADDGRYTLHGSVAASTSRLPARSARRIPAGAGCCTTAPAPGEWSTPGRFCLPAACPHQKGVRQYTERYMMMLPTPTPHFVIAHPEVLFALLETRLDGPPHPAQPYQRGQWGGRWCIAQGGLQLTGQDVAPQHQPDLGTWQTLAHRDDAQRRKAGDQGPFTPRLD